MSCRRFSVTFNLRGKYMTTVQIGQKQHSRSPLQPADKFSPVRLMRQQLTEAYRSARKRKITPHEWSVWSGQFNRTLRGLNTPQPVNACLFALWQSANRLLNLHLARRPKICKIRAEQRHLDKLKNQFDDLLAGRVDFGDAPKNIGNVALTKLYMKNYNTPRQRNGYSPYRPSGRIHDEL
jgi:hypothetical protein